MKLNQLRLVVVLFSFACVGRTVIGNDPFAEIQDVRIGDERFCDADLSMLLEIPSLRVLDLSRTAISDDGIALLLQKSKLAGLDFSRTQISDRSLLTFDKLPELRELDIASTNVTKGALEEFRRRNPRCLVFD